MKKQNTKGCLLFNITKQVFNQGSGRFATTAGSSTGNVVRVLGYALNSGASAHVYFSPDNTFIERS